MERVKCDVMNEFGMTSICVHFKLKRKGWKYRGEERRGEETRGEEYRKPELE